MRHGLVSAEIARTAGPSASVRHIFTDLLPAAFDGAKVAYQVGLAELSRDSLKITADLRKAVAEEVSKILETTRQLATALAGAVFLGVSLIAARLTSAAPGPAVVVLGLVLGAYVSAVIFTSVHFMKLQANIRAEWKVRLYSFLGEYEYKNMVTDPIAEAERGFKIAAWIAGIITVLLLVTMMAVASEGSTAASVTAAH